MLTHAIALPNRKLILSTQTLRRLELDPSGHVGLGGTGACSPKTDHCVPGRLDTRP
jgi:hypothetical protein